MDIDRPQISIAMATYNGEQYLRKQLDSIYAQTYPNIEVIVTDDCSSDATLNILDEYRISHGLQYYINESNLGFKKNFEKAVSYCSGEYIAFADQDDIWLPAKLSFLIDTIGSHDIICSDASLIDENDQIISELWLQRGFIPKKNNLFTYLLFGNFVAGCTVLLRRTFYDQFSPIPETEKYHDWWFALCASKNNGIKFVREPLVLYRQHSNQDTGAGFEDGKHWINRAVSLLVSRLHSHDSIRYRNSVVQRTRLIGLMELKLDWLNENDQQSIEDAFIYFDNFQKSYLHFRSFQISLKYADILYTKNYLYHKNLILDLIG